MKSKNKNIIKIATTFALGLSAVLSMSSAIKAAEITTPKTVVELFTSQGCSSCPAADVAMGKLVKSKDYLGLAFHVDYWDYIGWKDTFANPEFTQRQRNYAASMNERQIYTPQAIINGRAHVIGSHDNKIKSLSAEFLQAGKGLTVPINVQEIDGRFSVTIDPQDEYKDATLFAVYFQPIANVEITRGENAGKTLEYTNIVRKIEMLGMAGASGLQAEFSLSDIKAKGFENYALILQSKSGDNLPSAIIGASVVTDF